MKIRSIIFICTIFLTAGCSESYGDANFRQLSQGEFVIENSFLSRSFSVDDGIFRTVEINNKSADKKISPLGCDEFCLEILKEGSTSGKTTVLNTDDFQFQKFTEYDLQDGKGICFTLQNKQYGIKAAVHYELGSQDFYLRKYLEISCAKPIVLKRIDVDLIKNADAYQPYKFKQIFARGKGRWRPGLGQPLEGKDSATFWGLEFPAGDNFVTKNQIHCGYLCGKKVKANTLYKTYPSVLGVADDPEFISDAFYEYIDRIRIRPLRLQVQYNSWFDLGRGVNQDSFAKSAAKVHKELVAKRGVKSLKCYVIDDGWQESSKKADWSQKVWTVNNKFDPDFTHSLNAVEKCDSSLGLWLSPGCYFGAGPMVSKLKARGFEALNSGMSMAGDKYMSTLEERMVELTKQGVSFFKLDGLFGHLGIRNFDLNCDKYGLFGSSQLELNLPSDDNMLNDSKYDELKKYYLTAGTERLIELFGEVSKVNPDVYIVISNGAWLSPWWLMHVDTVWMINAGDAAKGSSRTEQLVYRDGVYHDIYAKEDTHFPMDSLFNHEPKKTSTGEDEDLFRKYLYMNLSRGTGFIELYIKTFKLSESDWDVLAEGLDWADKVFPTFKQSRMHGGDPGKGQVYGFTGWTRNQGYVSLHNPSDEKSHYSFTLDRKFGLLPDSKKFSLSSPLADPLTGLKKVYIYGDKITFTLGPEEIKILNFTIERF